MTTAARTTRRTLAEEIGKKKPFDSAEVEAYLNIVRTADRLTWAEAQLCKAHGISPTLYNTLRIVQGGGERGVQTQTIAEHLITRQPDVTRLVDRLEKMGLVERERCVADRRVVWVRITPTGRQKVKDLEGPLRQIHLDQLGHLTRKQLDAINELMVLARENIRQ